MGNVFSVGPGSLTDVYTSEEIPVGTIFLDGAKKYIFVKNAGSVAIAASDICTSLGTQPAAFQVQATAGNSNVEPFAGARVAGATSFTAGTWGWVQIGGTVTLNADAAGTAANTGVIVSNATVGAVEDMPNTGVGAQASFGVAATAVTSATVVVNLFKSIWGV